MDDLEQFGLTTSHYGFSAARIDELDASEYTLVTLLFDKSGSTSGFRKEMKAAADSVVKACSKSPRADNLMLRVCEFSSGFHEVFGFRKLSSIQEDETDCLLGTDGGATALYDATVNVIEATQKYGKTLIDNEFNVNGILFVITDGADNVSSLTENSVKEAFSNVVKSEMLESLVSVLIGVNCDSSVDFYLQNFHKNAGFTQYINIGDATPQKLAKLAEFVSKSISSQSQALGSGGPSQAINF